MSHIPNHDPIRYLHDDILLTRCHTLDVSVHFRTERNSADADAAQEAQAAENTGWFAYQSNQDAMDQTAGRAYAQNKAKCHHCWKPGHMRRNCLNREQPRDCNHWQQRHNNDDEDDAPPPRYQTLAAPRGRTNTIKPVHGSNVATYAPMQRSVLTTIVVPPTERHAPTPHASPISDVGFKPISHHTHLVTPTTPMTDDDFANVLADMEIRRAHAYAYGQTKKAKDIEFRMGLINFTWSCGKPSLDKLEEQLEQTESRLASALVKGTAMEISSLDCAANKLAENILKRNINYRPTHSTTANILLQRGRCSRKEGNVTFGPEPDPPTSRWKTPNTAVKQSRAEYAEEEAAVARLVADNLAQDPYRAKSPTTHYQPLSAQELQKYWE
ncbi:hypothetical protein EDB89DRAFT_2082835 [Lactarius sanguifluus]|nr:hypothetical protein EDB89DRAFT_2082835 [Lactarius sanguifluus]